MLNVDVFAVAITQGSGDNVIQLLSVDLLTPIRAAGYVGVGTGVGCNMVATGPDIKDGLLPRSVVYEFADNQASQRTAEEARE